MTFDCGSRIWRLDSILQILCEHQVQATFFLVGSEIKTRPDIPRAILKNSHALGNHSFSHPYFLTLSDEEILNELRKTDSIVGWSLKYFRPPHGAIDSRVRKLIEEAGYLIVIWTIDPIDWRKGQTAEKNY